VTYAMRVSLIGILCVFFNFCVLVAGPGAVENGAPAQADDRGGDKGYSAQESKKEEHQKRLQDKMHRLEVMIEHLGQQTEAAGQKVQRKMQKSMQWLKTKKERTKEKISEFTGATERTWHKAKHKAESSLTSLEQAYHRTVSRFKRTHDGDDRETSSP
jgi:hypothetical protein